MAKDTKVKKAPTPKKPKDHPKPPKPKSNIQAIIIAILSTIIACLVLTLGILMITGVIKFNNKDSNNDPINTPIVQPNDTPTQNNSNVDAPISIVACYDETKVQIHKLEFCLPDDFIGGSKSDDGAYTYTLVDDDGWAQVKVYYQKTTRTPSEFISYLSNSLKIVNQSYVVNGTTWVQAETDNYMQAFATKSDDYIYAILYSIKWGSEETREAWHMIPKTITITK